MKWQTQKVRRGITLQPSTAVYMSKGANVGIRQVGDDDLVLIVAYPAPK